MGKWNPTNSEIAIGEIFRADTTTHSSRFPHPLSPVSAGFPSPADDYEDTPLDLNKHLITHPTATFFVTVEGESMIDASIHPGDLLIVNRALRATDNRIVIAVLENEFTVKRLRISGNNVRLEAANSRYNTIVITPEMNFSVWGVVTYVIHRFA